jgi:hypothetical protein
VGEEAARALVPKMREWLEGMEPAVQTAKPEPAPGLVPNTLPVAG